MNQQPACVRKLWPHDALIKIFFFHSCANKQQLTIISHYLFLFAWKQEVWCGGGRVGKGRYLQAKPEVNLPRALYATAAIHSIYHLQDLRCSEDVTASKQGALQDLHACPEVLNSMPSPQKNTQTEKQWRCPPYWLPTDLEQGLLWGQFGSGCTCCECPSVPNFKDFYSTEQPFRGKILGL